MKLCCYHARVRHETPAARRPQNLAFLATTRAKPRSRHVTPGTTPPQDPGHDRSRLWSRGRLGRVPCRSSISPCAHSNHANDISGRTAPPATSCYSCCRDLARTATVPVLSGAVSLLIQHQPFSPGRSWAVADGNSGRAGSRQGNLLSTAAWPELSSGIPEEGWHEGAVLRRCGARKDTEDWKEKPRRCLCLFCRKRFCKMCFIVK